MSSSEIGGYVARHIEHLLFTARVLVLSTILAHKTISCKSDLQPLSLFVQVFIYNWILTKKASHRKAYSV